MHLLCNFGQINDFLFNRRSNACSVIFIVVGSRRFNTFQFSNWAWRCLNYIICNDACPVGAILRTINLLVVCEFPFASAVCFAIVALKNIVCGACQSVCIRNSPLLRAYFIGANDLLDHWMNLSRSSLLSLSLREYLILDMILSRALFFCVILSNDGAHHKGRSE